MHHRTFPHLQVHQFGSEPHDIGTPEKVGVRFCSEDRTLSVEREGEKEGSGEAADGEGGGVSTAADAAATGSGSDSKSPASVSRARLAHTGLIKFYVHGFDWCGNLQGGLLNELGFLVVLGQTDHCVAFNCITCIQYNNMFTFRFILL